MTSTIPLPSSAQMLERSRWIADTPGLAEEVRRWLATLPDERDRLTRQAIRLATPALHPLGIARAADVAGRTALAAVLWATADRGVTVYRRAMFGEPLDYGAAAIRRAEQVVRAGGPSYVKLGQFISTARGLLPDALVQAFSWCRDEVPPLPSGTARAIVRREIGAHALAHLDDDPLAAASIAQVHGARLADGSEVVVKVRRPGLRRVFETDVRALALAAAVAERRSSAARAANLSGFVELFAGLVLEELDFRLEALNMVELGLAAEDARLDFVRCPRPVPGLVTARVLVMERLPGVPYTDVVGLLDQDVDRGRMLRLAIQGVLEHTLVYGRFHGDLHAGNVLVDADGTFSLVDFGIVGRLTAEQRDAVVRLMIGLATDDIRPQLGGLVEFGAIPADTDLDALAAVLEAQRPDQAGTPLTHRDLADGLGRVIRVLVAHGFRLPKELVLFFKNLLYLNGFAAAVAPETDLLGEIDPIFRYFQSRYAEQMASIESFTSAGPGGRTTERG